MDTSESGKDRDGICVEKTGGLGSIAFFCHFRPGGTERISNAPSIDERES